MMYSVFHSTSTHYTQMAAPGWSPAKHKVVIITDTHDDGMDLVLLMESQSFSTLCIFL